MAASMMPLPSLTSCRAARSISSAGIPRFAQDDAMRFEILSRSESGLHFVRETKSGIVRTLTEEELRDFDDPKPCPECGEQFGCDHYNCAGERLLDDGEIDEAVPAEWREVAREGGLSRNDVARLRTIERTAEGKHQVAVDAASDMRTMELALLLDETLLAP